MTDSTNADVRSLSRLRERAGVRAKALRQSQTDAEAVLWNRLRNRQLLDLKFRRQRPIGSYFADFACLEVGLIVELDGGQHNVGSAPAYDTKRTQYLQAQGFKVLRFWNNEVLNETEAVMEKIRQVAEALTPALSRKREREQDTAFARKREREQDTAFARERERGQDTAFARERETQPNTSFALAND